MTINIQKIAAESAATLKGKMMGGVSKESAVDAITGAATRVADIMTEEAKVAQRNFQSSIDQLRRTHADEIASKDSFIRGQEVQISESKTALAQSQQENATLGKKLSGLANRIKRTATFRRIKTNPDGTEVLAKSNINGAKMEKVVNKDGKTIQINVEQLDGSVRRTTYNPETGKPIRTYTNTGKEPVELIYDQYGRSVKTRKVNVKKADAQNAPKPTVVSTKILRDDDGVRELESKMSDGSIKKVMVLKSNGEIIQSSHASCRDYWNATGVWYNKDNNGVRRFVKRTRNEAGKIVERWETIHPNGIKVVTPYSTVTDDFGITRVTARMTFPKSSKIKRIDRISVEGSHAPAKEIVKMKDGTTFELTDFKMWNTESRMPRDRFYCPTQATLITRDGIRTPLEKAKVAMLEWLKTFHPEFNKELYKA